MISIVFVDKFSNEAFNYKANNVFFKLILKNNASELNHFLKRKKRYFLTKISGIMKRLLFTQKITSKALYFSLFLSLVSYLA